MKLTAKLALALGLFTVAGLTLLALKPEPQGEFPTAPALTEAPVETVTEPATEPASPAEALLQGMDLRQKVGQLFIVRPDALDFQLAFEDVDNSRGEGMTALTREAAEALETYPVGGFILFGKNIISPEQTRSLNAQLGEASAITPFLAVDEEGGIVARLANNRSFGLPRYASAAAVGAEGPMAAQDMGQVIGSYLADYGFHMDFAPVADTNTNPRNPVIGTRAFSSDPREAAACARAMADGLRQQGIVPVFKHFPGHGDTAEDSHEQIAVSYKTQEELLSCEWIPFQQAENREAIMVGHIALPEVTGNLTPATFSRKVVTDCLRGELGYEGLIVTDSLSMGAVIRNYSPGQAALAALNAGCDLLLMPQDLQQAFDAVVEAVETGSFPAEKLDKIVLRILNVKLDYHMI